jgi:hypothetical protein
VTFQNDYADRLLDGEYVDVITDVYTDLLGEPVTALIFFGATGVAFFIYQERAIIPVVMVVLIGGISLSTLPPGPSRVVIILVLLAIASVVYLMYQRALGSSRFRS